MKDFNPWESIFDADPEESSSMSTILQHYKRLSYGDVHKYEAKHPNSRAALMRTIKNRSKIKATIATLAVAGLVVLLFTR